jgi:dTDP-4-amino-4,6-dideoxygalactose transaminase
MNIGFNKPYISGKEIDYILDAVKREKISGDGYYTKCCHHFFEKTYHFKKVLLTSSCTDALEMAALLIDIMPGDEVIVPSYTFVSSANPFILRGAKIVFADSKATNPNIDADQVEGLVTSRTKAIVVVHYAGIACEMEKIMALADKYKFFVIEDAAQAIDSFYNEKPLGGIGHLGCFSFHESKNISAGEGGLLVINDDRFIERAEIIWEKGTNRAAFYRGEVNKYDWKDIGSSFLPSELTAAFLYAQLENLKEIQSKRKAIWNAYYFQLKQLPNITVPEVPSYASKNAHMFYIVCKSVTQRNELMNYLSEKGIQAISHYLPLHKSEFFQEKHDGRELKNARNFSNQILRLPLYADMNFEAQEYIIEQLKSFFVKTVEYSLISEAV